jgi:hypothetical protein
MAHPGTPQHPPGVAFSPGRFRAWWHLRGVPAADLADTAGVKEAYVLACAYGHPVASPPEPAVLAAWATRLGCNPAELCSTTPRDPNEYWRAANRAMPPMSDDDLAAVADVFKRTARRAGPQKPAD